MRILVTGASGFVGRALIPELCRRFGSEAVSALLLPGEIPPADWQNRLQIFSGDIADPEAVQRACRGHSHVVHLAGLISYWRGDRRHLWRVNRDGTACLVAACLNAGIQRLVHVSTVGAVGFYPQGRPADEMTPFNWSEEFYYMTSKHEGQLIVEQAARHQGLTAVILNPASIIGPGDPNPNSPHNRVYNLVWHHRLLGSFRGGLGLVDVRDLVAAILRALDLGRSGERYLIVGANLTYRQVLRLIARHAGRRVWIVPLPAFLLVAVGGLLEVVSRISGRRPLLTRAYGHLSGWRTFYDNSRSIRELSMAYTDVETTLRDACRYYRERFLKKPH